MKIDKMNRNILNTLQQNGRLSYKDIAAKITRAQSTVRDRIQIMEDEGVILGYTAIINRKQVGLDCQAIIKCKVNPDKIDSAMDALKRIANVYEVYYTSGAYNLTFIIAAQDYQELKKTMVEKIIPAGIREYETTIITQAVRETAPVITR